MLTAGGTGFGVVLRPVVIDVQWEGLDSAASGMKASSRSAAEQMDSAGSAWQGLRGVYQQPDTQEVVWSAFDQVPEVTREWSEVLGGAAEVLQSFAAAAGVCRSVPGLWRLRRTAWRLRPGSRR